MYDRHKSWWRPEGKMRMIDLDNDVFLVYFNNPQDYDFALTGGPWMIFNYYLVYHGWDPSFLVTPVLPPKMVVWVRLPKLPIQYYHKEIIWGLGNLIGRTICIDRQTLSTTRSKFTRFEVEVNLREAVETGVFVDDAARSGLPKSSLTVLWLWMYSSWGYCVFQESST